MTSIPPGASGPRVVALGDSITAGVGDAQRAGMPQGWAAHVAHALAASSFTNVAHNGARARHLALTQVPRALMERPDVVLMTVGGNDLLRGDFDPREVEAHVASALERLTRPGRIVAVLTLDRVRLFSLIGTHVDAVMTRRVENVNAALRTACVSHGAVVIDGAQAIARAGKAGWHVDGIHPSALGHRLLAQSTIGALIADFPATVPMAPCPPPPHLASKAWWLARRGIPWVTKRSRDLIPHVASVVAHELLEDRRSRHDVANR